MMRRLLLSSGALLLLLTQCVLTINGQSAAKEIPGAATVEVTLLKAPGLNLAESNWEIAYEFRITNELSLWTERKKFDGQSTERVGDLIKQDTVSKSLDSPAGQRLQLQIPFNESTLARLRNQPTSLLKLTSANMTEENIKLNHENEVKSQVFLFYSVIRLYDAKLKKTFVMPVRRVWDFGAFPDARFEISIEINGVDSYSVKSSSPKNSQGGITIVK